MPAWDPGRLFGDASGRVRHTMEHQRPNNIPRHAADGRERLARLADFVEALPPGKLTFSRWFGLGRGCAVGLAAADPWFLAQGLRLSAKDSLKDCGPTYAGFSDWAAVAAFFEISPATARGLFDSAGYGGDMQPAPARVAHKIRRHLAPEPAAA